MDEDLPRLVVVLREKKKEVLICSSFGDEAERSVETGFTGARFTTRDGEGKIGCVELKT